jgi:protein-arginine kinase activator protein McsA
MNKECSRCGSNRPLVKFTKCTITKSGYRSYCKDCNNKYYANRRIEKYKQVREYEKKFHTERRLRYEYGITMETYKDMLKSSNGKCAICEKESKLVIDHCHSTGKVRGLLCQTCNKGLGLFYDNKETLNRAIDYLKGSNE